MIGSAGSFSRMAFETAIAEQQLRPAHDSDAHGVDGPVADGAHRGRDEVAIDVAVDDRRCVLALERRGQAQDRERKARVTVRRDRRVDEQNALRGGHDLSRVRVRA